MLGRSLMGVHMLERCERLEPASVQTMLLDVSTVPPSAEGLEEAGLAAALPFGWKYRAVSLC